jgi:HEPN domain-containing protein
MEGALKDGQADLALSTAAHCVIAACDAILAFNMHRRSIASDHSRVAGMIEELELPGAPQKARQIEFVLSLMSAGEYDDREVTSAEVEKAVKMARRVLDWAEENLPRD